MTQKDAEKLEQKDEVFFAGNFYEVSELPNFTNGFFIGIYDEPPTKHIDYLNPKNVMKVYPCNKCQGGGCLDCGGFGKYPSTI